MAGGQPLNFLRISRPVYISLYSDVGANMPTELRNPVLVQKMLQFNLPSPLDSQLRPARYRLTHDIKK